MSALTPPPADAPAEEWGAFAVSIPGWRNPRLPCMPYLLSPSQTSNVPDPDHWAWEGWMLRLVGAGVFSVWMAENWREGDDERIGRACIRVAAAHGRWPGGDS